MNLPTIGNIYCAAFPFAPKDFVPCDGRLLSIANYEGLFKVIGSQYGGDGATNFAAPDLRSRAPRHVDSSNPIGVRSGVETVQLALDQIPPHTHALQANPGTADSASIDGNVLAAGDPRGINAYAAPSATLDGLDPLSVGETGGNGSHANLQPFLAMNYLIAWNGALGINDPADEPYIGEVRAFPWGATPSGWLPCDGRSLPIPAYAALYGLIGPTFGGDGATSFNVPDLRGRVPIGVGQGSDLSPYTMGERGGTETVSLAIAAMPAHSHAPESVTGAPTTGDPSGNMLASEAAIFNLPSSLDATLDGSAIGVTGEGAGHDNMMPFLALNYCICFQGVYPARS
ncbi:MAG: tail fiber protein [Bryobacterales bacterium]|nr:tail fiber protein [Bryobacterales bacterium]